MNNTSLQDLLRHQDSYIVHKPFTSSIAGTSTITDQPPLISPPLTPTIAFNVLKPKRKKPDTLALSTTTSSSTPIPPCTECGKRFSSWKALFGHMRCHPERQWRGINPPPNLRRGAQFTSEEYEVASSLILLANGPGRWKKKRLTITTDHEASTSPEIDHKCSVCLKGFSSGQALGGHMRCHWDRMDDCSLNAVVVAATAGAKDFVLDLNLLPVDQGCAVAVEEDTGGLDLRLKI